MLDWFMMFGGGVLLYFGAEWFVGGASALALTLRIPHLLVGLTVVAYGTSAPEIIVGVHAAHGGHGEVALGNVIGSNIANIGLILGCAALIRPARVDGSMRRRELPMLVGTALLVPLLLLDGVVSRLESCALLAVALAYTIWMVRAARSASALAEASIAARVSAEAADEAGAPKPMGSLRAALTAAFGLAVLLLGGTIGVDGAVAVAQSLGMSERLVGLTIVALGTSLPELVTSVVAARKGHSDMAIGNVMGSNIFNVLLVLGASGIAGPVAAPLHSLGVDVAALLIITLLGALFIRTERTITRREGAVAVALYAGFMLVTALRG